MNDCPLVWIVMGVAGSGKTLVGRRLSAWLESDFLEGDRRHPTANLLKMLAQTPLEDDDRHQWLVAMEEDIRRAITYQRETVITCSALKAAYRTRLTAPGRVQLVWLNVPQLELERRLSQRLNHYMKLDMLHSQLAAFEPVRPEEPVITVDGCVTPEAIVKDILNQAIQQFPQMQAPWWQRSSGLPAEHQD
jgi:gluconokinase